jgi:hypothetical protein
MIPRFLWLVAVMLVQWLLVQGLPLSRFGNPYLYLWFFLWLPYGTSKPSLYLLAFIVGSTMDSFEGSGGAHTIASLMLVLFKPVVENALIGFRKSDNEESLANLALGSYLAPAALLVLIHHFTLFAMESYGFFPLSELILRTVVSTVSTVVLLSIAHILFSKRYAA